MKFFGKRCESCSLRVIRGLTVLGEAVENYDYLLALAGNPNTGKSTLFNRLTGLTQHTGNWPGKTVEKKEGAFRYGSYTYKLVDLPGTYSLMAHSEDEEIARNFLLFSKPDATVVVTDAMRLERNLNLVLQILAVTDKVVVALNMIDEAEKNGIEIDTRHLARRLGVPVVKISARSGYGIEELLQTVEGVVTGKIKTKPLRIGVPTGKLKSMKEEVGRALEKLLPGISQSEWLAIRLLTGDKTIEEALRQPERYFPHVKTSKDYKEKLEDLFRKILVYRTEIGDNFYDFITENIYAFASEIADESVRGKITHTRLDQKIDYYVTHRIYGFVIMFFLLALVLWITIRGANYPSEWLNELLIGRLYPYFKELTSGWPRWLSGILVDGIWLTTAWVVSVMLPPMAIFFPLFTLLEDFGYLPRVAFNLDKLYKKSGAHGKQALTMTMGFGCNAAAVVSTRIIDSPRDRLIAILTNNFSLCNGRWPTQILLATLFVGALVPAQWSDAVSMLTVAGIAILGVGFSFFGSWLLSKTLLRGEISAFYLELPPYRVPDFRKTIYTSVVDRTMVVLWRAVVFAAPAGALIWILTHVEAGNASLAEHLITGLDPLGKVMGLNGIILLAFIIGIPANEIIIPSVIMLIILIYRINLQGIETGVLTEIGDYETLRKLFEISGWTLLTAVNFMLFSLLHNPCSTTIYTIYKETRSVKWTLVATFFPLIVGFIVTSVINLVAGL